MFPGNLTLEDLQTIMGFLPNENQRRAIQAIEEPLFLIAGPGSGKTRVLLWRVVNLIVFHNVEPGQIFLSTFTEKAAKQLKDGLQSILGEVTNRTGRAFDLTSMYVGTVHSLCQRMLSDRRFIKDRSRPSLPILIDELDQYFFIGDFDFWNKFVFLSDMETPILLEKMKSYFDSRSKSKHSAVMSLMGLFNRWSEENLTVSHLKSVQSMLGDDFMEILIAGYEQYLSLLKTPTRERVDFSLLQQSAFSLLQESDHVTEVFEHVIIDEYQDTNTIQEQIFFRLAKGRKRICVVGDDDQALYRFRGATVENFVQFSERCKIILQKEPTTILLDTNYRSRAEIVQFYKTFMQTHDWRRPDGNGYYRLVEKNITPHSQDSGVSVVASSNSSPISVAEEIAIFVKQLLDVGKVTDPNQIAFLFPSLKSVHVSNMRRLLKMLVLRFMRQELVDLLKLRNQRRCLVYFS